MNHKNYMKFVFPSYAGNEAFARTAVASFVSQLDPTLEELGDIRTAVSEAVTNCIIHAYPRERGIITLRCRILNDSTLDIVIKDRGVGISNLEQAKKPMYSTGNGERSGMGFTIMESFMSSFSVNSVPGKGTTVYMKKRIKKHEG